MNSQNTKNTKAQKKPAQKNNGATLNLELSLELANLLGMGPGSEWERRCLKGRR